MRGVGGGLRRGRRGRIFGKFCFVLLGIRVGLWLT